MPSDGRQELCVAHWSCGPAPVSPSLMLCCECEYLAVPGSCVFMAAWNCIELFETRFTVATRQDNAVLGSLWIFRVAVHECERARQWAQPEATWRTTRRRHSLMEFVADPAAHAPDLTPCPKPPTCPSCPLCPPSPPEHLHDLQLVGRTDHRPKPHAIFTLSTTWLLFACCLLPPHCWEWDCWGNCQ